MMVPAVHDDWACVSDGVLLVVHVPREGEYGAGVGGHAVKWYSGTGGSDAVGGHPEVAAMLA